MDILHQFGVDPILLLAQVVNFLILLFILKKFLYKPILKVLEERKSRIEDSLKNAEEIERRLVEISERETAALLKTAKESEQIIKDASSQGSQIIGDANKTAQQIISKAAAEGKQLMVQEKEKLEQSIRENTADLIFMVVQKVTGKLLTKKDQEKIVKDSLRDSRS